MAMNTWLEPELERGLREVTAPPELWDRLQSAASRQPAGEYSHGWYGHMALHRRIVAAIGVVGVKFALHALARIRSAIAVSLPESRGVTGLGARQNRDSMCRCGTSPRPPFN